MLYLIIHYRLVHPKSKNVCAAYMDNKTDSLRELTLKMSMDVWGVNNSIWEERGYTTAGRRVTYTGSSSNNVRGGGGGRGTPRSNSPFFIPTIPSKYVEFVAKRREMYNEISNMVSVHGHNNVLELYEVLEDIQDSKATIFLILELAEGGELFDHINSDDGTREEVAKAYFHQLLSGLHYCHERGICHRDLKPENLLLSSDQKVFYCIDASFSFVIQHSN